MRIAAIIGLCFAAVVLVIGALTSSWGSIEGSGFMEADRLRWGLQEVLVCEDAFLGQSCEGVSFADAGWPDAAVRFASITLLGAIVVGLLLSTGALLTGLQSRAARAVNVAAMIASSLVLVPAALFIANWPELVEDREASLGSSFYLFTLAAIVGLLSAAAASRRRFSHAAAPTTGDQPPEPIELPDHLAETALPGAPRGARPTPVPLPPPAVAVPNCPHCNRQAVWIHEHRQFACVYCNQYLPR